MDAMKRIVVVGGGNVASHLMRALSDTHHSYQPIQISSRTLQGLPYDADVYVLAVADNAISEVANNMHRVLTHAGVDTSAVFVTHTAGSVPMEALQVYFDRSGVFYPLQTLSKDAEVDYAAIPFLIEAAEESDVAILEDMVRAIGAKHYLTNSATRLKIHAASVIACNLPNRLWALAEKIMQENDIPFSLLQPLIEVSAFKLRHLSPAESQTGPARRGDTSTIARHQDALSDQPEILEIYNLVTKSILDEFHPEISANMVSK